MTDLRSTPASWPSLPLDEWRDTYATLHMWSQIVGKTKLACSPALNHWWHVALVVSARGLTTGVMYHGGRAFEVEFDFMDHVLFIRTSDGQTETLALGPRPVAEFFAEYLAALRRLGIHLSLYGVPVEVETAIPFAKDREHASYDPEYASRVWRIFVLTDRVLREFRGGFQGKASPVHFFWGGFDLAVTRFSGRRAPEHPGGIPNVAAWVMREAYSHEVASAGFWPGSGPVKEAAFYAYAYPEPEGFAAAPVRPRDAFYHTEMREFILPYEAVRTARSPEAALLDFLQSTYDAAANLGAWDRAVLERPHPPA